MNLIQMRAFREVMTTGSVSEAARNLGRTQPAVSATIARLEADLGVTLFERRGRRLIPVPEARYLDEEARAILERMDRLDGDMRRLRAREVGTITIASMPGPSVHFLPRLMADLATDRPDLRFRLLQRSSDAVVQQIASGQSDLGICDAMALPKRERTPFDHETQSLPCLCALPSIAPEAELPIIDFERLAGRPLATLIQPHQTTRMLDELCSTAGFVPNIVIRAQTFVSLLPFVQRAQVWAIVDPIARLGWGENTGIVFRPLFPSISFDVAILTPDQGPVSLLAREVRHLVSTAFSEISRDTGSSD